MEESRGAAATPRQRCEKCGAAEAAAGGSALARAIGVHGHPRASERRASATTIRRQARTRAGRQASDRTLSAFGTRPEIQLECNGIGSGIIMTLGADVAAPRN